jgi:hypothetical protein
MFSHEATRRKHEGGKLQTGFTGFNGIKRLIEILFNLVNPVYCLLPLPFFVFPSCDFVGEKV